MEGFRSLKVVAQKGEHFIVTLQDIDDYECTSFTVELLDVPGATLEADHENLIVRLPPTSYETTPVIVTIREPWEDREFKVYPIRKGGDDALPLGT